MRKCLLTAILSIYTLSMPTSFGAEISELIEERTHTAVVIEYVIEHDLHREPKTVGGLVIDNDGLIAINFYDIPKNINLHKLRDFKAYPIGNDKQVYAAEYLGADNLMGWHYVRVEPAFRDQLKPISEFGQATPQKGEAIWGISFVSYFDNEYEPSVYQSHVNFIDITPYTIGWAQAFIGDVGMPVFNAAGEFAGWGSLPLSMPVTLNIDGVQYASQITSAGPTQRFIYAKDFFKYIKGPPSKVQGDPIPWVGIVGIQSLNKQALKFLGIKDASALVVGNVIEDGPAGLAGLKAGDIIIKINDTPIPSFPGTYAYGEFFGLYVRQQAIGNILRLTLYRDQSLQEIEIQISTSPPPVRLMQRDYFPKFGWALRAFAFDDALKHHIWKQTSKGVIVDFVKRNSPIQDAGIRPGDWIQKIDNIKVEDFEDAVSILEGIKENPERTFFVLLVVREGETKILRVKIES